MAEALELLGVPTPRLNPDLKGQAEAEREFLQEFGTGQMHHAWLISGPRGVGKATFAFRIARHVLAQKTLIQEDPAQTLDFVYNSHTENSDAIYDSLKTLLPVQLFYGVHYGLPT